MTQLSRRAVLESLGVAGGTALVGATTVLGSGESGTTTTAEGTTTAGETTVPAEETTVGPTQLRVVHASPDAPAVDVYVNDEVVLEGVEFSDVSPYLELDPGTYNIKVVPAGESTDAAVIDTDATLEAGTPYTVAAANTLDAIEAIVYEDDNSITEGQARLRAIHLAPDAPAVDIAVEGGPVLIEGLEFTEASEYIEVDPGVYEIAVRPAGSEDVVASFPDVELEADTVYTGFALGFLEGDPEFTLKVVADAGAGVLTTTAPGTTAPGTTAPGTTAPGTTAPGTTAPAADTTTAGAETTADGMTTVSDGTTTGGMETTDGGTTTTNSDY